MIEWKEPEWSDDGDSLDGECDHCGRTTLVQLRVDPFIDEIYPESPNEVTSWCRPCWSDRHEDV